jgi:hypothetical protein
MTNSTEPWFVAERGEALAGLILTSREDLCVRVERKHEIGPDFLVEIKTNDPLSTQLFIVEVKGTTSSSPQDWITQVRPLFRAPDSKIFMPVCVFLMNVVDKQGHYAWVAEPRVEKKGPILQFHESPDFHKLDASAVSAIIDQVKAWYQILQKQLQPA